MLETVLTSLIDQFSWLRHKKTKVILGMCTLFFLLGLTMCSHVGIYVLGLLRSFSPVRSKFTAVHSSTFTHRVAPTCCS